MNFNDSHVNYQNQCNAQLEKVVREYFVQGSVVSGAAAYALLNAGKRVRAVLLQASCAMLGGCANTGLAFAAAVEMVHAFSLVHDDLPCMDDDDLRRGKPATHIAYGQANALLAGDMLLAEAFNVIARADANAKMLIQAVQILASATGANGMIYGQELDLRYERQRADEAMLHSIHTKKTGALLFAAVQLGALAAGQNLHADMPLALYARNVGLVFQIVDDILDVAGITQELGKPAGSDEKSHKATFVSLFGISNAKKQVESLTKQATDALFAEYGEDASFLKLYAEKLANRIY